MREAGEKKAGEKKAGEKKAIVLSARMQAVADMVSKGNTVCDLGCDHGYLSIYLVQNKISPKVVAMDVREGPLSRCASHVASCGLEQYITLRLSDGLSEFSPGEAQTLVCAGMGGRLMRRILTEGAKKACRFEELVLQPQSETEELRKFLRVEGYRIVEENMIEEEGKFYPMMRAVPVKAFPQEKGQAPMQASLPEKAGRMEDRFGGLLLEAAHPVLQRYLKYREQVLMGIRENVAKGKLALGKPAFGQSGQDQFGLSKSALNRLEEVDSELADIRLALRKFYHRT